MLAGCSSSTLLSPRHRLRSESAAQLIQACHFQLPSSMSTQRLDLPCPFSHKESSRPPPIRPVGVGLKQNIWLPPLATTTSHSVRVGGGDLWERETKGKGLKRFADGSVDDSCTKRKRGNADCGGGDDDDNGLSFGQFGSGNIWFQSGFEVPRRLNPQHVPGEVISPPLPLSNNPWVDSVITEISDLGEKDGESSQRPTTEGSGSSNSSGGHNLGLGLSESVVEREIGNGSKDQHPREGTSMEAGRKEENQQGEHQGFELVSLLAECVGAIGSKNVVGINHFIGRLGELASPIGNTPVSRLAAYYTEALALRVTRLWPHVFHLTPPRELDRIEEDSGMALRLWNQISPIPKFIHFTANEILLRAFEGKDRIHIIDFDIKQGLQWPSLFQSLASRRNPPCHVRITGLGELKQELNETGTRLAGFAEAFNLPFEFHPVVDRLEDVRLWMLHVKEGESVAVNCIFQMHKMLYDTSGGTLRDFLGLIRSTNLAVMVMAEQEAEHNVPHLEARVCNSLKYYSAIFDLIDSVLPRGSGARIRIEEMFAREIRNVIACERSSRVERHESFGTWKKLMEQEGFHNMEISEREMLQSQMLLRMGSCENYRVKQQGEEAAEALTLSWLDQPLYTVSAWRPSDAVAGSSASLSQPS